MREQLDVSDLLGRHVIDTDVSNITATKTGRELINLPVAIATRARPCVSETLPPIGS